MRDGEITVNYLKNEEKIKKGECAFIPSNTLHSYKTADFSLVDVCIFSGDFVPSFTKEIRGKQPESCRFVCKDSVLDFAKKEFFVEGKVMDLYTAKSVLYAISGEILQQIDFKRSTAKKDVLFDRLIDYISENFLEDISLETAAKTLGYEKHYLSRCFHQGMQMNFSRYVNMLRVDTATELLQNSDLSITEIAFSSGFQSVRTFNRVFLELTGKNPRDYFDNTKI